MPEIADGLVEIHGVAREPGYRSKIAVESHAQGVDPVGACVGPRGSRVRMVVSELRGEKIDIIPWNPEPARFVAKALSPARVREVYIDDETREATVVVPDDQLALAIGKEGLNARLAARLTGWKVDIKSDTEFAQAEAEAAFGGGDGDGDFSGRCAAILSNGKRCPNAALPGLALLRRPRAPGARERDAAARGAAGRRRPAAETSRREEAEPRRADGVRSRSLAEEAFDGRREPSPRRARGRGSRRGRRGATDVAPRRLAEEARATRDARAPRTCAGCGRSAPQRELLRFAAVDGVLTPGRRAGRGAYTCRTSRASSGQSTRRAFAAPSDDRPRRPELARLYTEEPMADGPNKTESPAPPARRRPGGRRAASSSTGGAAARPRRARGARPLAQAPPRHAAGRAADRPRLVESGVTVQDLSQALGVPMPQIIKILMGLGQMRTATQSLTDEEVELIAAEVEREITIKHAADDERSPRSSRTPRQTSTRGRRS